MTTAFVQLRLFRFMGLGGGPGQSPSIAGGNMAFINQFVARLVQSVPDEMRELDRWRRRTASLVGALLIGLMALIFAHIGDVAQQMFSRMTSGTWWFPLLWTPALFVVLAALTTRIAPESRGSGIPQVIAAAHAPDSENSSRLLSLRAGLAKLFLTIGALFGGPRCRWARR